MRPEVIIELLHSQPFRPLAFHFNDGSQFTVSHPELVIVERDHIWFFRPSDDEGMADGFRLGSLQNLTSVEPANISAK